MNRDFERMAARAAPAIFVVLWSTGFEHVSPVRSFGSFHGQLEAYRFRRQLYYATCAILVSIPSSYSEGVRYPSPF